MLPSPSFTSIRSHVTDKFNTLRNRARLSSWFAKLLKQPNSPKSFVASSASGLYARRQAGIRVIRVDRIVGTIQRTDDFDKDFRPLKKHLRDRWVSAFLRLEADEWEPILVHQVGESYYVKDGHHRVSVSRSVGMLYIEAQVWEHNPHPAAHSCCTSEHKPVRRRAQAYSTHI